MLLKFRGYNKTTKQFIDFEKITPLALSDLNIKGVFIPDDENIIIDERTTWRDINNNYLFVNDIIEVDYEHPITGEIKKIRGCIDADKWGYILELLQYGTTVSLNTVLIDEDTEFTIIGNYHQNPELLDLN